MDTLTPAPASDCDSFAASTDNNDIESSTKKSQRQKRKRTNTTDAQLAKFMSEMKGLFSDFKEQQEQKLNKIYSTIEEIKLQNTDIRTSIDFLSGKYECITMEIDALKKEVARNQDYIITMQDKLEKIERSSRSTCLEIRNIPFGKSETKTILSKTVTDIVKVLNLKMETQDIKDIFRIKTKNPENKTIIVELSSVIMKERILNAYKKFNKTNGKLNTTSLRIPGPPKPVFLSENLTAKMKRLFYLARDFAKSNDYSYCWSTGGKIFIRKKEGAPLHWIKEETDLQKLTNLQ